MKRFATVFTLVSVFAISALSSTHGSQTPPDKGWEKLSTDNGITVYRKDVEGSDVVSVRGEGDVDSSMAKVASVLADSPRKPEWMDKVVEAKLIRQINEYERVEYTHTAVPWPFKDRDFLVHSVAVPNEAAKQLVINLKSVDDPAMPEIGSYVRGSIFGSTFILTALDGGARTHVSVEIHADPSGGIPKWLVNLFQKSWPRKTLEGIRTQAAKADIPEHPKVKAFFEKKTL